MRLELERGQKLADRQAAECAQHESKNAKSAAMFKNTKITSCSQILSKNGQAVCMAFNNGAPKPVDLSTKKSSETVSFSASQRRVRDTLHAGMLKKPLEPYHPNSFRSRLP